MTLDDVKSHMLTQALADYVVALEHAASVTKRAEDRSIYKSLLADAAVLLARAAKGEAPSLLQDGATAHERLWGQSWLVDPAYKKPSSLWRVAYEAIAGHVI
jgi:hypothetical protein